MIGCSGINSGSFKEKMKLPKRKSVAQLKKQVWAIFSQYIRMRDCLRTTGCSSFGLCITCSKRYHIKLLQAGHFIPGRHNANLFSEEGTHAQCYNCNINLRGNTLEYRRKVIELYGEGKDVELEERARETKKFTVDELINLKEYYTQKVKELGRT